MKTLSRWRQRYRPIISRALADLPVEADRKACERALHPLYPDGARENHPYRMWRAEVREQLDKRFGAKVGKLVQVFLCASGVWCRLCLAFNYTSCILCGPARDRWRALPPATRQEFAALMHARRKGQHDADGPAKDWSIDYMNGLPIGESDG